MRLIIVLLTLLLNGCLTTANDNDDGIPMLSNVDDSVQLIDTSTPLSKAAQERLNVSLDLGYDKSKMDEKDVASALRIKAISIDAYSWGIQEGVYYRTGVIQNLLERNSQTIHKMVSLGKFVVDGKMLMPTVVETERIYVKNSDVSSTEIERAYTLDKKPRIVSQIPTWRDYLKRTVEEPEEPLKHSLPRTKDEQTSWAQEFKRGWNGGIKQANTIFNNDLSRMHSDIAGLYRYRYLLAQNIVFLPVISQVKTGVLVLDSGNTIYLNNVENLIEVTTPFNDINEWKPVFYQGDAHE